MCYILMSCLEYYFNFKKNYKINLSLDYILFNLVVVGCVFSVKDVLNFLVKDGMVNVVILFYDVGEIMNVVFVIQKYKINNFFFFFNGFICIMQKIFEIKKVLIRGNFVIVELQLDDKVIFF